MGLWTHFARGSNFLNWTLFGSGYAGLVRMTVWSDRTPVALPTGCE
jgi:hypothetical protein